MSHSGFTKSAKLKAACHNIETKTTKEIYNTDWKAEYQKIGTCIINYSININKVLVELIDGSEYRVRSSTMAFYNDEQFTFGNLIEFLSENGWNEKIQKEFGDQLMNIHKVKSDLTKTVKLEHTIPGNNIKLKKGAELVKLKKIKIQLVAKPTMMDLNSRHYKYENSLITKSVYDDHKIAKQFVVFATQAKPKTNKIHISRSLR